MNYVQWGVTHMVLPCCFVELNVAFLREVISGWSDCAFRIMIVAFWLHLCRRRLLFQGLSTGFFSGEVPDEAANASLC